MPTETLPTQGRLDLNDVSSSLVRKDYIRGAYRNGRDHARAGLPSRHHLQCPRWSEERSEFILAVAYTHGYWKNVKTEDAE